MTLPSSSLAYRKTDGLKAFLPSEAEGMTGACHGVQLGCIAPSPPHPLRSLSQVPRDHHPPQSSRSPPSLPPSAASPTENPSDPNLSRSDAFPMLEICPGPTAPPAVRPRDRAVPRPVSARSRSPTSVLPVRRLASEVGRGLGCPAATAGDAYSPARLLLASPRRGWLLKA